MAKLKSALELAEPPAPPSTPLRSAVEMTSADLLKQIEEKAQRLQAEAEASAAAAEDFRRSVSGKHADLSAAVNRLARAILERRWTRAEADLAVTPQDEDDVASLLVQHAHERDFYNYSRTRQGDPFAVELPRERAFELYGARAGEKAWVLLVDLATREIRAKAAARRVAVLDKEIADLVLTIRASVAANGFALEDLARNAASLALPFDGERKVLDAVDVLDELEAAR